MTVWFTIDSFRQLCFELATQAAWMANEPIPAFETRYPGRLESCIETPRQTYTGIPLYPTLMDQAAILFYLLSKNHPFVNGNKRLALTALLVFLFINGKWIVTEQEELYNFSVGVAASETKDKDAVLERIKQFLTQHLTASPNHPECEPQLVAGASVFATATSEN